MSGCLTSILVIKAPRLLFCPTSLVVFENLSMKDIAPVDVPAALVTLASFGLNVDMSQPTPHLRLKSCANC